MSSKWQVDFNCDLGEGFGRYKLGIDTVIVPEVTSVNIACGWHAGDPSTMRDTVVLAKRFNVGIGAHPGFPDLLGFGRRRLSISDADARVYIWYQVGALMGIAKAQGACLTHVKPHGALYNMACEDRKLAQAIAEAVYALDPELILMGLSGSALIDAGRAVGLTVAEEVFSDRAYNGDGTLVSRTIEGAVIEDVSEVICRTIQMVKEGRVRAIDGKWVAVRADSICIHGDHLGAEQRAAAIRKALEAADIDVVKLSEVCAHG